MCISLLLENNNQNFLDIEDDVAEVGVVLNIADAIATIFGLDWSFVSELIIFDVYLPLVGLVSNLEYEVTGVVVLGQDELINESDLVERTYEELQLNVGFHLIGSVIDPTGLNLDLNT